MSKEQESTISKWTPEPWTLHDCGSPHCNVIGRAVKTVVADGPDDAHEEWDFEQTASGYNQGDVQRIVACINACAGLDLPDDVPVGALREVVGALEWSLGELKVALGRRWQRDDWEYYAPVVKARHALTKLVVEVTP